jgi:hypothetical protein
MLDTFFYAFFVVEFLERELGVLYGDIVSHEDKFPLVVRLRLSAFIDTVA